MASSPPSPFAQGLSSIVKLDMFAKLSTEEIVQVWSSYHAAKADAVATTAAPRDWQVVKQRATQCSLFALPLFQNEGYVTMLCQFAGDSFVLVPLQSVKDEGEAAKPWLMVSYYDDLAADKGVVLVRGSIMDGRMTKVECDVLMHLLHRQYSVDVAYGQVLQFTHHNDQFDWEAHVMQCKDAVEQAVAELARAKLLLKQEELGKKGVDS